MKKLLVALTLCAAAAAQADVTVGFTGDFDSNKWTASTSGDVPAGSGATIDATKAQLILGPTGLDQAGARIPAEGDGFVDLSIPVMLGAGASRITFDWSYSTADDPFYQAFGILNNGVFEQLTDDGGDLDQTGTGSFIATSATRSFGFRLANFTTGYGDAEAIITNFRAQDIPEPGTLALLAAGLLGGAAARRRKAA